MFSLRACLAVIDASGLEKHSVAILERLKALGLIADGYVSQSDLDSVMGEF